MEKIQVLLKVEQDDFTTITTVICASTNIDILKQKFRDEVEKEKQFEIEQNLNYDTVNETENSFEAYNQGYMAESSVSIFITETPLV